MPRSSRKASRAARDLAKENFTAGEKLVHDHPLLSALYMHCSIIRQENNLCPADGWAIVTRNGAIHVHPTRRGLPEEWLYVLAHCLLHLGFGHFQERPRWREWNAACDCFVGKFLADLKIGRPPEDLLAAVQTPAATEDRVYEQFCERGIPADLQIVGTGGPHVGDMRWEPLKLDWRGKAFDWQECFGLGLARAASRAVDIAAGVATSFADYSASAKSLAQQARSWFISSYPLLGSLAATFKIIEDQLLCQRMGIAVAAISMESKEIFINPIAGLDEQEMRFVMGHELLHAGLRHDVRCQGRDPYLWNIACDYVINGWLVEMGLGQLPHIGALYDPSLKGESAESIYDRIVTDLRRYRKLATLRGVGVSDILEPGRPDWWNHGEGVSLDELYRRALSQGLTYHQEQGRGLLPAGLIEEIQALSQPPIPWDVELAQWFDEHFPPIEKIRSYARPSRHQSATPDIPRPRWIPPPNWAEGRTYGVLLDTSGSMDRALLAKALGAIASYSISREVPAVRVVFCDAATYDQGYLPPEDIAGRVKVRGRGGTILQPGVDLLEHAKDFPNSGPLLIITDGYCDKLTIRREHAFLLPAGHFLPFVPKGQVFRIS
jgi:predicted metal-dependent peptidase